MKFIVVVALLNLSLAALAAPAVKTWSNPECATGNCELKGMKLYIDTNNGQYRMAGNAISAEIETVRKEDLAKYAFVQYIEGCVFETNSQGQIKMGTREYWGRQGQPFKHVGMQLDSAGDKDPIYWSNTKAGYDDLRGFEIPRNSYYQIGTEMLKTKTGSWAGKISNLKNGAKIYAEDMPTPSGWDLDETTMKVSARQASLRFRICLHKIEDVPGTVDSPSTIIPGAITCMTWNSNFMYNFATRKFDDKKDEIHPACK